MANEGASPDPRAVARASTEALLRKFGAKGGRGLGTDRRLLYGKQLGRIFSDQLTQQDVNQGFQAAGEYYAPTSYGTSQTATDEDVDRAGGNTPSFMEWDIPTSSTNYQRPRTVAAGYDPDRQTMTVVFRDGTFYNYYEVTPGEWEAFHASYSKGRPWLNRGFPSGSQKADGLFISKPRGDAGDGANIDPSIREQLYRVARAQQIKTRPSQGRTTQKLRNSNGEFLLPTKRSRGSFVVPNAKGRNPASSMGSPKSAMGKNPATANRAPRRKAS